ncbi:MAG: FAD-dependent oxidoreductase [Rhodocyclaceae bacterium]|nr:FAD-dependent oxidoreductase [Rhodocyclaceae bacterium]
MSSNPYPHLLKPGRIGSMVLRNRMVVTAMGVGLAEADGSCGERIRAYHGEQARGGAAMVITGCAGVAWPLGAVQPGQIALSDDRFIPGLAALAEAVHAHGARLAFQLHHGGPGSTEDRLAGRPILVPSLPESSSPGRFESFLPEALTASAAEPTASASFRAMTGEDIRALIEQFAAAAERVKRAGADGVEIHGGDGYLLSAFLSPKSNRRADDYGGSLENRARLLLEVMHAVRHRVGQYFPLWVKLDSREVGKPGGITLEDGLLIARMVEAAGAEAVTVTAEQDSNRSRPSLTPPASLQPGASLPYALRIKAAVAIPVIVSGHIEPEGGDGAIRRGQVDFIAMGRKLLADPHLPEKLAQGRAGDVRPCIYCDTCISAIATREPVRCAVNPEAGREYLGRPKMAGPVRHVVVIGGGPGGMELACRLDGAGQRVTLLEKSERLGGTLRFAALTYDANERLLDWYQRRLKASGVQVRLGVAATPAIVRDLRPDLVVVATGALRTLPPIPGSDRPHVFSGNDFRALMLGERTPELARKTGRITRLAASLGAVTGISAKLDLVRKATRGWMPLGKQIVILGGELVALELAGFLGARRRTVSVIDEAAQFGAGLPLVRRLRLLDQLTKQGVVLHRQAGEIRIEADVVRFIDRAGQAQAIGADHVIVARGATADLALANQLKSEGFTVHAVGDCTGIGYIEGALGGAARLAIELA